MALELYQSTENYPVDFDDAWQWLEYSNKANAKTAFIACGFIESTDFISFHDTSRKPQGGRPAENIQLTCECLKQWGMMCGTSKGKEIRAYFIECERIAKTSHKPKSQIELLVESAQILLEIEKRQQKQESEILNLKSDIEVINQRAIAAEQELKALPAPSKTSQSRTARANINSLVRAFCHKNNIQHAEAFKNLYREFRDRYHIDLKIRAANGKSAPLDIAESLDVAEDLYALADEMFGGVNA